MHTPWKIVFLSQAHPRKLLTGLASRTARSTTVFGDLVAASHETVDITGHKSLERGLSFASSGWFKPCSLFLKNSCTTPRPTIVFHSFGFGRPAGQKSNKSNASDVQGPCSLGSFSLLAASGDPSAGAWRAVKAVGSDIDLRSGESRDLFPVNLLIVEGDLNPDPSVISSKTNCVEVEGTNSSFAELSGAAVSLRRNQYRDLG